MNLTLAMRAHYALRHKKVWDRVLAFKAEKEQSAWSRRGRLGPPNGVKQAMVRDHARTYALKTLVETGTYLGDMVYTMRNYFDHIYSIELSSDLHRLARRSLAPYSNIHLIEGDSAAELGKLLARIEDRCLFWLDGHYSGGITASTDVWSPITAEIEAVAAHPIKDHVLLIDDAVCFNGLHGYPTLREIQNLAAERFPTHRVQMFDNVIQVTPSHGV